MILPARALVFDMDGLMVDSEPLWCAVEGDFCRARGGEWTAELASRCIGQGLANTLRVMHEVLGFDVDIARDTAAIIASFVARVDGLALKPGCRELIEGARGSVPLALGSSSSMRLIDAVLARFDLAASFDAVVSGECVASPKPAPDIFARAAALLGVAAEGCVVLEDSLAGVMAARAAGMRVIAVPEGDPAGRGFHEHADAVVKDLWEARRLLSF